ncbi:hypothetical protein ACJZ2D_016826 [Fusarium nematophilum]
MDMVTNSPSSTTIQTQDNGGSIQLPHDPVMGIAASMILSDPADRQRAPNIRPALPTWVPKREQTTLAARSWRMSVRSKEKSEAVEGAKKALPEITARCQNHLTLCFSTGIKAFDDLHYKAYNPVAVESAWSEWWEKEVFFRPELTDEGQVKDAASFVIVLPPRNITDNLRTDHALGNALQDIMMRWSHIHGKTTLWLPGCDHASISTQSVVENMLWRRQGKTRHDLGRTKFIETVWEWKEEYHQRINNVQRKMGGSLTGAGKPLPWTRTSRLPW